MRHVELPHMRAATWDALLWCLRWLAATQPDMFLFEHGQDIVWSNGRLGLEQRFRFGDDASLPSKPLVFLGSQIQEDAILLDQREGQLWVDAGCITFASNWSLAFNIGMSFREIHGPVPHDLAYGAITKAERFLLGLGAGEPFRRNNWTSTAGRRLDTALDSAIEWAPSRAALATSEHFADIFHLRVEVQHLVRLPQTGAILFLIRTYLLPLKRIMHVPEWRTELSMALKSLSPDMLQYKGLAPIKDR